MALLEQMGYKKISSLRSDIKNEVVSKITVNEQYSGGNLRRVISFRLTRELLERAGWNPDVKNRLNIGFNKESTSCLLEWDPEGEYALTIEGEHVIGKPRNRFTAKFTWEKGICKEPICGKAVKFEPQLIGAKIKLMQFHLPKELFVA